MKTYRILFLFFTLLICSINCFTQEGLAIVRIVYKPFHIDLDVDYGKISYNQKSKLSSMGVDIRKVSSSDWKDKIVEQFEEKGWNISRETDDILEFQIDIGNPIDNSSVDASMLYAKIAYKQYHIDLDVDYGKISYNQKSKLSSMGAYITKVRGGSDWKDKIVEQFEEKGWRLYSDMKEILRFQIDIGNPIDNSSVDASMLYAKIAYKQYHIDLDVDYGKISYNQKSKLSSMGAYITKVRGGSDWKDKIVEQFEEKGWNISRETDDILEFQIDIDNPIDNSSPNASTLYAKIAYKQYHIDLDVDYGKISYNQKSKLSSMGAYITKVRGGSDWKDKIVEQFEEKGWNISRETDDILEFQIDIDNPIDNSSPNASTLYAKIAYKQYHIDLDVDYGKISYNQKSKLSSMGAYITKVRGGSDWKDKIVEQFEEKGWQISRATENTLEFQIDILN